MTTRWSLLCSTGAFARDPDQTKYQAILHFGPLLDVDGLEVIFFSDWYSSYSSISNALATSGLPFPVLHSEKSIGPLLGSSKHADLLLALERLTLNCQFAQAIGAYTVVLHLWGLPESDDAIERNLSALGQCLNIADNSGVVLAIETIPCRRADPLSHIRQATTQDARCGVALDTEFLAIHQQVKSALSSDWLWQTDVVKHIHIKDYDGHMFDVGGSRRYLHPGEGSIDFDQLFAGLTQHNFAGTISLEASAVAADGSVDIARIQHSLARLRNYR